MLKIVITCEHAGNQIPKKYKKLFSKAETLLEGHKGYDPGALELAKTFASLCEAPLFVNKWSRLLIEMNRSLHHPALFSSFTRDLSNQEKKILIDCYYLPYRSEIQCYMDKLIQQGHSLLHLSIHTFTPILDGLARKADIAWLYDPERQREKLFCTRWRQELFELYRDYRLRMNYPYQGKADGFTTYLRSRYGQEKYKGIEIEVNQLFPLTGKRSWKQLKDRLAFSLTKTLVTYGYVPSIRRHNSSTTR